MNKSKGFTLVEIMIALTISLVLMAGVISIMISSKKTYSLQNEFSRLQESARFVIHDMNHSVRMAGFMGCAAAVPDNAPVAMKNIKKIEGISNQRIRIATRDNQGNYTITAATTTKPVKNSDVLTVNYFGDELTHAFEPNYALNASAEDKKTAIKNSQNQIEIAFGPANTFIPLASNSIYPVTGEEVIISDCGGSRLYTVSGTSANGFTISNPLGRGYLWPVSIFRVADAANTASITYEVAAIDKNGNGNANDAEDGFALFRNDELFVEGVENLQIRYGVSSTAKSKVVSRYQLLPSGSTVRSVRINLLLRTMFKRYDIKDSVNIDFPLDTSDGSIGSYNPSQHTHEAGFRHRFFTNTIQVRN